MLTGAWLYSPFILSLFCVFLSREEAALTPKSVDRKPYVAAVKQTETQRLREAKLKKQEDKELFKLTRYTKLTSHNDD